jgi:hypothetical protein
MFGKKKAKPEEKPTPHFLENEEMFRKHFDLPHADFMTLLDAFDEDRMEKYESISAVDEEAAILWAIHEGKQVGIVQTVA